MQKLISSLKTLSSRQSPNFSTNLFSTSSRSVPSPAFVQRLRSCEFASTTGDFKAITMASSATGELPAVIEDGLGKKYWRKFKKEWTEALYTPFVIALAAGNLKLDTFRDYIAQDVYFLRAFVKAYELAEECADDDDAKLGINALRKNVLKELKMHDSSGDVWGFNLPKDITPNAAAVKYTDFLLSTASGKVDGIKAPGKLATPFEKTKLAAYTIGAMTPCMRLYAFLGKELQTLVDPNEGVHPYQKWIDNYSSDAFQAAALQTEDLLETLSVSLTGEELDIIEKLYFHAMKLEIEFFLAQPLAQKIVVPLSKEHIPTEKRLMLFSDFDLTCTVVDSSAILAEIAIVTAPKSDQNQSETQLARMSSVDLRNTWGELSKDYTEEYEQCIDSILHSDKEDKFNYLGLRAALENLSDFEKKANSRVIESGVLKGLNADDIKRAGGRLILHDGCTNFFQNAVRNEKLNKNINILSYCWCGDLIRSAFSSVGLEDGTIHANEFVYEDSISTGEIVKKIESPIDKVQVFTKILQNCCNDKETLTIYIGDSVGDVLCLLEADVGIVIGSSASLRRVGIHFGVSFVPLFPSLVAKQKQVTDESMPGWKGLSGVLYTVSSWAEIHAFILGL
ncbi:beta ketoadipyl CoA thiolase, th2 [Salvia divinorum]|uniref:Beta ketoadipyl CoA thiolase, th2 n=1 Tax=Salvia divinorum TaxID=28513 RepID=A0ABD1H7W0_SALDI